jgi:hypothetical protein
MSVHWRGWLTTPLLQLIKVCRGTSDISASLVKLSRDAFLTLLKALVNSEGLLVMVSHLTGYALDTVGFSNAPAAQLRCSQVTQTAA